MGQEDEDEAEVRRTLERAGADAAAGKEAHRFGAEAMAQVVIALRAGASCDDAAKAAGFAAETVQRWRRRSAAFGAACADAIAATSVPRLVAVKEGTGEYRMRRGRRAKFTAERKESFLGHFAATLDAVAAAQAAGVCFATAYVHRRTDPAFAEAWQEAAAIGVARLSEEAGRQRLAAMAKLGFDGGKEVPREESEREFERTMTFLKIWQGKLGGAKAGGPPLTKWSFEAALDELERKLRTFGVRIAREEEEGEEREGPPPAPPASGRGEEGGGGGAAAA